MGYPGPLGPLGADHPKGLHPETPTTDTTLDCDVVVIGSGAGGGTAAAVLAAQGLEVVVLEKGGYFDDADFTGTELTGLTTLYASGPSATAEGQMSLLEAQCLGGGTVVNYSTSFRTPDRIRHEWAATGATEFLSDDYDRAMDAVWSRQGVNGDYSQPSHRDQIMERGLTAFGWHIGSLDRNVIGCDAGAVCGRCGYGCPLGAKQSVAKTWLMDAEAAGARILTGVDVRTITTARGSAKSVEGRTASGVTVTVRARAVVVAGGSVQTPAILKRSGFTNPNIGRHLRLHPATAVWAEFDEEVRPWEGAMQSRYSTERSDIGGSGYGVVYETAAANPALSVAFLSWRGAQRHLEIMRNLSHFSSVGVITRDQDSGEVKVGKDGEPTMHYTLSARDAARMHAGVDGGARILEAAMAALHIMGSARMGGSAETSAANPEGVTWEAENVVIADASTFPTSSGVNPMVTIEAIAHLNATRLAGRLT
ncbi:hypothetical protein GCM10009808_14580 [Microbacterium sediminicola]|uniref:GMC family oxidoreductase n=1 Tax=Microbacterium sediminicola TaxID=415210 RepID=A0ABP4U718_9MICO